MNMDPSIPAKVATQTRSGVFEEATIEGPFAFRLGLHAALANAGVIILSALAAGFAVVLVAGSPAVVGVVAGIGAIVVGGIAIPIAYRSAYRLGMRVQRLSSTIDAVSPIFAGSDEEVETVVACDRERKQLGARIDWLNRRIVNVARGARSITIERDRTRERLTRQSEAKSNFFARMSHDLRTPLNAILGYATLLQEDARERSDKSATADLERIQSSGRRLLALIDDLLTMSGLQDGRVDSERLAFKPEELVREAGAQLGIAEGGEPHIVIEDKLNAMLLVGDRTKVVRCLKNLLDSARRHATNPVLRILIRTNKGKVDIAIFDDGPPIEKAMAEKIFDPETMERSGTSDAVRGSLGLALSRNLARSFGGDCRADTSVKRGACLVLTLPVETGLTDEDNMIESTETVTVIAAESVEPHKQIRTALIIDDDPAAIDLLGRWLRRWNYCTISAESGEAGLAMAKTHKPDLILLDAFMPGKNGYEVLTEMRANEALAGTPILLVTVDDDRARGLEAGASDYLRKPLSEEQLRRVIATYDLGAKGDILIIDDDDDAADIMQCNLDRLGFTTARANGGEEGLKMARENHFAAIVLDLAMPRINGFEFLDALGGDLEMAGIPVIVVSGYDLSLPQYRSLVDAGAIYFRKGTSAPREIAETLRELVA